MGKNVYDELDDYLTRAKRKSSSHVIAEAKVRECTEIVLFHSFPPLAILLISPFLLSSLLPPQFPDGNAGRGPLPEPQRHRPSRPRRCHRRPHLTPCGLQRRQCQTPAGLLPLRRQARRTTCLGRLRPHHHRQPPPSRAKPGAPPRPWPLRGSVCVSRRAARQEARQPGRRRRRGAKAGGRYQGGGAGGARVASGVRRRVAELF